MSLYHGIDTVSYVSLGLYTKTFGAVSHTIVEGHPLVTQACINSLYVSLGMVENAVVTGGWVRFINILGWPWRKIWKDWA